MESSLRARELGLEQSRTRSIGGDFQGKIGHFQGPSVYWLCNRASAGWILYSLSLEVLVKYSGTSKTSAKPRASGEGVGGTGLGRNDMVLSQVLCAPRSK